MPDPSQNMPPQERQQSGQEPLQVDGAPDLPALPGSGEVAALDPLQPVVAALDHVPARSNPGAGALSDGAVALLTRVRGIAEDGMPWSLNADEIVAAGELLTAGLVRAEDGIEGLDLWLVDPA